MPAESTAKSDATAAKSAATSTAGAEAAKDDVAEDDVAEAGRKSGDASTPAAGSPAGVAGDEAASGPTSGATTEPKTASEPGPPTEVKSPADTNARLAAEEVAAQINERAPADTSAAQAAISLPAARKPGAKPAEDKTTVVKPAANKAAAGKTAASKAAAGKAPASKTTASKTTGSKAAATKTTTAAVTDPKADAPGAATATPAGTAVIGVPAARTTATPAFPRSNRPVWQPMVPPSTRSKGLTIFGTTLTRRQTVIGVAILAAIMLLVGVLVPLAFAGDDSEKAGGGTQTGANPAASAPATGAANVPPPATGDNKTPDKQAPPTKGEASSPPAKPSSAAPVTGQTLPKGWTRHSGNGFTVPLPPGFTASQRGSEVYFNGPGGRLLIIDQTDNPKPDPVADWAAQEKVRRNTTYRGYQRIRIDNVSGYFQKTADWEFTYTTKSGNAQHAQKRGIVVNANKAFGISWYTSPDDWDANKATLNAIYQGFKPA